MSRYFAATALAVVTLLPSAVFAQHHHHHHHTHVHSYSSGGYWGHPHWSHVSPAHSYYGHHHHGTFYVDAGRYYYIPTQVTYVTTASYSAPPPPLPSQAPVQLSFGGFAYSNDLTGRFETEANLYCLDLSYNYSQNPGFAETYREAYDILQSAKSLMDADHHGDRAEIARRVTDIDRQFHQVQMEVGRFQRQPRRQIGTGSILTKSQAMEAVLHHLAYTVGVELHSAQPGFGPGGREEAPPPPSGPAPMLKSPAPPALP